MTQARPLPRSTPEEQGVESSAILGFLTEADARLDSLHSIMLLRHGTVVAEGWWNPYGPEKVHEVYSVSKSVTALAVGLVREEGLLDLDDLVIDLLPGDAPVTPPPELATLSIRHLLTMTTGHTVDVVFAIDPAAPGTWASTMMGHPAELAPGASFVYNSAASYLLSAIVQRLTGQRMLDYLRPRVLDPIGIVDATWQTSPQGIDAGGWGLSITTEGLARFAQLCLQRGEWEGRQLVPAEWIEEATARHVDTSHGDHKLDGQHGYGYHFWRNSVGGYRADGAFGQFGIVLPEQDAVLAITAGVQESQDILDLAWKHLLPAFAPAPLPESPAREALRDKLRSLEVPKVEGAMTSPVGQRVSGIHWVFDDAEISGVTLDEGSVTLTSGGGQQAFPIGTEEWTVVKSARVAVSSGWVEPDSLQVKACLYETPFAQTYSLHFDGSGLALTVEVNAAFDESRKRRVLRGRPAE